MAEMTDIQKNMIAELLESGKCTSEFEKGFMESMQTKVEKKYSLSFKQNDILEGMYDRHILGTKTIRDRYEFGYVVVQKLDDKHLWEVFINDHKYGDAIPKGEAISAGMWLSKHLQTIALDWGFDDSQRAAIAGWGEEKEDTTEKAEPASKDKEDDDVPF